MKRMYRSQWYRATAQRQRGGSLLALLWNWLRGRA